MRFSTTLFIFLFLSTSAMAQSGPPPAHVQDVAVVTLVFTNATLHVDAYTVLRNATLIVKDGQVVTADQKAKIPTGALVRDLAGAHIWPALVEPYSDLGIAKSSSTEREKELVGAANWNGALRADAQATRLIKSDPKREEAMREQGFATVISHRMDGIARGNSLALVLDGTPLQEAVIGSDLAGHFSFKRGSSPDNYPRSQMGAIALLRQSFLDAERIHGHPSAANDPVLLAIARQMKGRAVFEAANRNEVLRCGKLMNEFGITGVIKGNGDEYARVHAIRALAKPLIIPVNFPDAEDVEDPYDALEVPLDKLTHWAMAPCNAAILDSATVMFAFTTDGRKDVKDLWKDMRRMVKCGLDSARAIAAFTTEPARLFGLEDRVGALRPGMLANFLITNDHLLSEKIVINETWVRGVRFVINESGSTKIAGMYDLNLANEVWTLEVKDVEGKLSGKAKRTGSTDTAAVKATIERDGIRISISFTTKGEDIVRLSGLIHADGGLWDGQGQRSGGAWFPWSAIRKAMIRPNPAIPNDSTAVKLPELKPIRFPLSGYGWTTPPEQGTVIFRHATVWTNAAEGILRDVDVCIHEGKIKAVGASLEATSLFPGKKKPVITEVNATGKHLTTGIIDEHSHIAISRGVNEGSSAISAEVRIGDVIDPDDINIYRDLAGGVTAAQLLHGSANPIGGQSALIKMRWGRTADSMLIDNAPKRIKFALGENVKQSNWNAETKRFPQSRMGVEQFFYESFYRAKDYEREWRMWREMKPKEREGKVAPRRDLRMETLVEILNGERSISCHSYVQSEIDMLMHVADSMHFKVNTFTHILEGYKVAEKMMEHGASASTFSDWWAYKFEVYDAIPYNAALLNAAGVNTAINSDNAEMGRRLNQEAAKTVKYGGVSEEEAWKMVTLNPAKMLKLDHRMGTVEVGKDADIVIWSHKPLDIRARPERTYVDGICYYDLEEDIIRRKAIELERDRLVRAMIMAKQNGAKTRKPEREEQHLWHCEDIGDGEQSNEKH